MEVGGPRQATNAEEDWIRTPNRHPAIISQELFDAAQEQLRVKGEPLRRRELNTAKRYAAQMAPALRGKVICGHCGHTMIISSTKKRGVSLPVYARRSRRRLPQTAHPKK